MPRKQFLGTPFATRMVEIYFDHCRSTDERKREMFIRFSEVQDKEMIEAGSGKFIGFVVDAEVDEETGRIMYFYVARPKKFYSFAKEEQITKKVAVADILIIGQDVILIKA